MHVLECDVCAAKVIERATALAQRQKTIWEALGC